MHAAVTDLRATRLPGVNRRGGEYRPDPRSRIFAKFLDLLDEFWFGQIVPNLLVPISLKNPHPHPHRRIVFRRLPARLRRDG